MPESFRRYTVGLDTLVPENSVIGRTNLSAAPSFSSAKSTQMFGPAWWGQHKQGLHDAIFSMENIPGTLSSMATALTAGLSSAEGSKEAVAVSAFTAVMISFAGALENIKEGNAAPLAADITKASAATLNAVVAFYPEGDTKHKLEIAARWVNVAAATLVSYTTGTQHSISVARQRFNESLAVRTEQEEEEMQDVQNPMFSPGHQVGASPSFLPGSIRRSATAHPIRQAPQSTESRASNYRAPQHTYSANSNVVPGMAR